MDITKVGRLVEGAIEVNEALHRYIEYELLFELEQHITKNSCTSSLKN
jgi:hypothetical protein